MSQLPPTVTRGNDVIVLVDHGDGFRNSPSCAITFRDSSCGEACPAHGADHQGRVKAFTFLRQIGLIPLLTGVAPDAPLRLVPVFMGQFPDPRLMPRSGLARRIGFLCIYTTRLDRPAHPV